MAMAGVAAAALATLAGLVVAFWYPGFAFRRTAGPAATAQKFDAAVVPLVFDGVRAQLATYEREPGAKAIAISREGWGIGTGAPNEEIRQERGAGKVR